MCLASTIEYACVRCQGTVMKDAYQGAGTACAEAAAKGPGFFGAGQRGVERLLRRGESLCAGCELDDEVRDLDASSAVLTLRGGSGQDADDGEGHPRPMLILAATTTTTKTTTTTTTTTTVALH